jgi:uncharacterized membrane protein
MNKAELIEIVNIADLLAIPMFVLMIYYFIKKSNRNLIENILLLFAIVGLIVDLYFTITFYSF